MKFLILGGTGAIGVSLISLLEDSDNEIYVTSRRERTSTHNNIKYIKGDAHNDDFLDKLLDDTWDVIVDFMAYKTPEFQSKYKKMQNATGQYIFLSSARVYSNKSEIITEDTPRLLDVCTDEEYLLTDEYALSKARQENFLFESDIKNYTIIRPYITYNLNRFQLGTFEKEMWLSRALRGKKVLFYEDIANHYTTLTNGEDVAKGIFYLMGNNNAKGEAFHITGEECLTWGEIADIYSRHLKEIAGLDVRYHYEKHGIDQAKILHNDYQVQYDRLFDRRFDNKKIFNICNDRLTFTGISDGLENALNNFFENNIEMKISPSWEAYCDSLTKDKKEYNFGKKGNMIYTAYRYMPGITRMLFNK